MKTFKAWLHRITAPVEVQPASLPFCTRCKEGLHRGQKYTLVTFHHHTCKCEAK